MQQEIRPEFPPADLLTGLADAYRVLSERCDEAEPAVAVRSSATDEDGATASFAGQYETILNVRGAEAIAVAMLECWAAARSARVAHYRRLQGMPGAGALLPILVQQLICADVSAVVFSANPVTGNRGEIIVNSSWGLGDSIVGGHVTPDSFVIRRSDYALMERAIARKRRMTVPNDGPRADGTHQVDVPTCLQHVPSLDDAQVLEVARLATMLEAEVGAPVDVECAAAGRTLYLLQCRPITTLVREGGERA